MSRGDGALPYSSTASDHFVHLVEKLLKVLRTSVLGDILERIGREFAVQWDRHIPNLAGIWILVSEFDVAALLVDLSKPPVAECFDNLDAGKRAPCY